MLLQCKSCGTVPHSQDKLNNKVRGERVHNVLKNGVEAKCTVCGNVRNTGKVITVRESDVQ